MKYSQDCSGKVNPFSGCQNTFSGHDCQQDSLDVVIDGKLIKLKDKISGPSSLNHVQDITVSSCSLSWIA